MKLIECNVCGDEFNLYSPEKKEAGGLFRHCPSCAKETAVKHLGVGDGCGKQSSVQVLAFETKEDRQNYARYWAGATGMGTGKNSHMSYLPSPIQQKFRKVYEGNQNNNHKGRDD